MEAIEALQKQIDEQSELIVLTCSPKQCALTFSNKDKINDCLPSEEDSEVRVPRLNSKRTTSMGTIVTWEISQSFYELNRWNKKERSTTDLQINRNSGQFIETRVMIDSVSTMKKVIRGTCVKAAPKF